MRISDLHEHEYRTLNNQKNLSDIEEEIIFWRTTSTENGVEVTTGPARPSSPLQ
jgi:hypothetical protein